jgi:hypothetical protein
VTVEAMRVGQVVLVQDSKRPASAGGQLQAWGHAEWRSLLGAVSAGVPDVAVDVQRDGSVLFGRAWRSDDVLTFDAGEWLAFVEGVRAGEFDVERLSTPSRCEASSSSVGAAEEGEAGASPRGGAPAEVAAGVCGVGAVTPAPVAADLDSPAGRPRDASTGEVVLSPADRPGSDAAGTGASPGPVPAARIWVLAEEPGPEVTHVIDADGDQWTHRLSVIDGCDWHLDEEGMDLSWPQLLVEYGPLTDATPAAAPLVPTDGAS